MLRGSSRWSPPRRTGTRLRPPAPASAQRRGRSVSSLVVTTPRRGLPRAQPFASKAARIAASTPCRRGGASSCHCLAGTGCECEGTGACRTAPSNARCKPARAQRGTSLARRTIYGFEPKSCVPSSGGQFGTDFLTTLLAWLHFWQVIRMLMHMRNATGVFYGCEATKGREQRTLAERALRHRLFSI